MITSIGFDVADINRFDNFVEKQKMPRLFSKNEFDYIAMKNNAPETIAGMFCAKEAFFKALGTGITNIAELAQVEIGHNKLGAPYYIFPPELVKKYEIKNINVLVSISHTKTVAAAVCVFDGSTIPLLISKNESP